ncbi:MAG: hypothetical protein IPO90_15360 [Flavobacteriales bacterium]|nr:hypothetical protein [Flavobacteriales bacterium]
MPSRFVDVNGDILFIASTPAAGAELWRTDGTPTGTHLVKDIWPGQPQSSLNWLTAFDGTLFFTADDGVHGYELWKSDGSEAGTVLIKDIDPGPNNGLYPGLITELGGLVYFRADEPITGQELWRTDGTEAGTVMVKDINPGSTSSDISQMIVVNGQMLFWAVADTNGWTLWRSDGTETGTVLVKNIDPVFAPSALRAFYEVNGVAYFFAADTIHGGELWRTDGTEQGTWMVKDIRPDSASSWISEMRVLGDGVIFSAFTDAHGRELWLSDGTEQGTQLVLDLYPGPEDGTIGLYNPVVVGDWLYFVGNDGTLQPPLGLFKTNGTAISMITDVPNGIGSLTLGCGGVFFDGHDGVNGWELWYSNGTPDGTYMAADINTGLGTSHPNDFLDDGERLIFSASTSANGDEPWILPCSFVGTEELNQMPDLIIAPVPSRGLVSIELPRGDGPGDRGSRTAWVA